MISRLPTPIETRWLDYAIKVLNDDSHRAVCGSKETEGTHGDPKLDKFLRWPGYLAFCRGFARRKVSSVGNVVHAIARSEATRCSISSRPRSPSIQRCGSARRPWTAPSIAPTMDATVSVSFPDAAAKPMPASGSSA